MLLLLLLQKISKFNKLRQPCSRLFLEELEEVDIFEVSQDTIVLLSKKISSDYQFREIFNQFDKLWRKGEDNKRYGVCHLRFLELWANSTQRKQ